MASFQKAETVTLEAGAAFTNADFGKLVEMSATDRRVTIVDGTTDTIVGVLAETPKTEGEGVAIALLHGILKMQAGGNVTAGQIAVPANDGQVTGVANIAALGADVMGVGVFVTSGAEDEIVEVLAMPLVSATSA